MSGKFVNRAIQSDLNLSKPIILGNKIGHRHICSTMHGRFGLEADAGGNWHQTTVVDQRSNDSLIIAFHK